MSSIAVPNERAEDHRLATAYRSARRSWLWPLLVVLALTLAEKVVSPKFVPDLVVPLVVLVVGIVGLASAIHALVTVPRVGRRSTLKQALIGVVLSLVLVMVGLIGLV